MLPDYTNYTYEDAYLFPGWPERHTLVSKMKKWSVRNFFKRTLGLTTTSTNLRCMMEMAATKLYQENKIDANMR
jgi:hypothetical protein